MILYICCFYFMCKRDFICFVCFCYLYDFIFFFKKELIVYIMYISILKGFKIKKLLIKKDIKVGFLFYFKIKCLWYNFMKN